MENTWKINTEIVNIEVTIARSQFMNDDAGYYKLSFNGRDPYLAQSNRVQFSIPSGTDNVIQFINSLNMSEINDLKLTHGK